MEVTCTNLVLVKIWIFFNNDKRRKEVAVGKVAAHLCLTLIIKELKISVEHDRVVTTLNIIFSVVTYLQALSFSISFWLWHWWGRKGEHDASSWEKRERFLLHWLYIGVSIWLCNMYLICKHWHSMKNEKMPWFWAFALRVRKWAVVVCGHLREM